MKCGEAIHVKNFWGSYTVRFIAQCHGQFLLISNSLDPRNGYLLLDWHGVVRELVAMAVPAKLTEKVQDVQGAPDGRYVCFPLTYPLSAKGLADLLAVPVNEVREQLADLAVEVD